jgi:anti-sigma-K factor RskA
MAGHKLMDHQDYQDSLTLYALDALEASAARSLEAHLATCESCRADLAGLRDAAALMAHGAPRAEPSDQVRAKILTKIRAGSTAPRVSNVVPMPPRPALWPTVLRLAAALAFVTLLIGIFVLWRREVRMQQEIVQLQRQLTTERNELSHDRDLLTRHKEALALLNSANAKKLPMTGSQTASSAHGTFVYDEKTGRGILLAEGLPATSSDKAYELWFIPKDGSPMPGRIFTVDASGRAMLPQQVPPEAGVNAVVAITLEPRKGSASPTGAIYLRSPGS